MKSLLRFALPSVLGIALLAHLRRCARGTYPPAPLFASLIVGYACAYEERGVKLL